MSENKTMMESEYITGLRSGFETYYSSVLKPKFADAEIQRKKYLCFFIVAIVAGFIVVPGIVIALFMSALTQGSSSFPYQSVKDLPLGTIFFGILILLVIVSTPILIYKKKSKARVMPEFIKYFGDFSYHYQSYIDDDTLIQSKLFKDYNHHTGDDFFIGSYKDVQMIISEEKLTRISTNNEGRAHTWLVFKGIAISLAMNKNFNGQTVVFKDWGIFNALHKLENLGSGLKKISLEDSIFEKEFEVYGTDQLEARYLLTTAFMERMLKVRDAYKANKIEFSFFNNNLLIAIESYKDMFESTSLFHSTTERKRIDETFEQFASVMGIIDILKLDKRLGM